MENRCVSHREIAKEIESAFTIKSSMTQKTHNWTKSENKPGNCPNFNRYRLDKKGR